MGSFPPARACFSWPCRCFGLPRLPLPAIKSARQPFVIITLDPLSEHFRGRNALGFAAQNFQAGGALQLNANSKSSPSRWGCFMKRFSADVVSCAQKLAATLCPCNVLLAACQFAMSCSLLADFCSSSPTSSVALHARAPSCRFALAAFDLLSCAGVEADSW